MAIATGKTESRAKRGSGTPSRPFRATNHLKTDAERAAYLEALLNDGDNRVITVALRELAGSIGGVSVLAERTGLSRETLYRTLSQRGNPRLETLNSLLLAMGMRLSVTTIER